MIRVGVMLIVLCLPVLSVAAEYFVTKSGSDANSCAAAQDIATAKLTLTSVLTCEAAADTIWVGDGTYTDTSIGAAISAGTSISARTAIRAINPRQAIYRPNASSTGGHALLLTNKSFVWLDGIVIDAGAGGTVTNDALKVDGTSTRWLLTNVELRNSQKMGLLITRLSTGGVMRDSEIHDNGVSNLEHGIYAQADDWIFERNEIYGNAQMAIQFYQTEFPPKRIIFRGNYTHDNCQRPLDGGSEVFVAHESHIVENNFIVVGPTCTTGITVDLKNPLNNTLRQNSFYCIGGSCTLGINLKTSSTVGTVVQNNVIVGFGTPINNAGTGTVLTDNLTSGTATDIFTDPANDNLTLKAGSVPINGGTNIALPFCGTNPEQGATEKPEVVAASINGNTLDVVICTANPPIQPLGTWTPACTGTGCGTPVSSSISVTAGGLVRITVGGISGGACAAGQTWTISASGANTDSTLIGNQFNQSLHTVTNFPVDSSACTGGGGPGFPAGAAAIYNFENNLNDSSGNGNHAIGSANIAYTAAHDGQGVQFANGVDSYVDTGLLSGHNPSTSHLVVAFGVRLSASELGKRRQIAGVSLGTNQRFYIRRDSDNIWDFATQSVTSPVNTEFPVVAGDTHVCVKFHPTTDTATLYINGQVGTISGASVQSYTSYTFPSTFRLGLPPTDFTVAQSPPDIIDQAYIYTTDVSCADIYAAWQPPVSSTTMAQAAHQWQGVYLPNGSPENRGAVNEQRTVVKGGAAALVAQLNCEGGDCAVLQPRFRYSINGGAFNSVVPDSPTADGVSFWGSDGSSILNGGVAGGPLSGSLTHTNGITALTSVATPTIDQGNNTSYTMRGIFSIDMPMPDPNVPPRVCFKVYDQSGDPLASYAPAEGACLTQKNTTASGGP